MSKNVKIQNFEGQSTTYSGVNYIKVLDADTEGQYDQFQLPPKLQSKAASPKTSAQSITPDSGYDALSSVNISAIQTEQKTITQNGDFWPSTGKFFSKVTVNVPSPTPNLQEKTATPSTSSQEVTPDSNYDGLSKVTVNAVPTEEKTATANGTVTPSSGKFLSKVTVNVPTATLTGTATASDVAKGKTFYNTDTDTKITGTLEEWGTSKQLSGTWQFKTSVDLTNDIRGDLTFQTYNGGDIGFGRIIVYAGTPTTRRILAYRRNDGTLIQVYNNYSTGSTAGWNFASQEYRNITFESPQSVSEGFYNWFTANATQTGGSSTGADFTITANGTTELTDLNGKIVRKSPTILVNVPTAAPTLQAKTVNPTTSQQEVTADSGYDALSKVTVNAIQTETKSVTPTTSAQTVTPTSEKYLSSVSVGAIQTVEKTITMNGTYLPGDGKYFSQVVVNVAQSGVNAVKFIGTTWEPSTDYLPFDVTYTIETTNSTVVSVSKGTSAWILNAVGLGRATVTCHDSSGNQKGSYIVEVVAKEGFPIEVNTAVGMAEVLKASNVGKVYKFTGTTDSTYTNGDLYLVEET